MTLEEWKNEISTVYERLPIKFRTYRWKVCFKSIAVDWLLLRDISSDIELALRVGRSIYDVANTPDQIRLDALVASLDSYYAWRRDDGRWERGTFGRLRTRPLCPIFVLSYGRWGKNAILERFERYNESEVFDNTMVFVQPDQEERYCAGHPKFHYYPQKVNSVGERMLAVLQFCRKWGIERAIVLEDDIAEFRHIRKGGVEGNSKASGLSEEWGSAYLKYIYYKGSEIMDVDSDCVLVGMRNRALCNNEQSSLVGYHDPMRGGCPNMAYLIDVRRFYPLYLQIPEEHYSPQYDWAIQCTIVRNEKHWVMLTGVVKNESLSRSVIGYSGDREKLAEEYLRYYDVQDSMSYRKFGGTKLEGVKIFYNSRLCNDEMNKKLF